MKKLPGWINGEKFGDNLRKFFGDVIEHLVILRPLLGGRVQVEAGSAAEVVTLILEKKEVLIRSALRGRP